jgi:hypothetical protein
MFLVMVLRLNGPVSLIFTACYPLTRSAASFAFFPVRSTDSSPASLGLSPALAFGPYFLEFIIGEMFDANEGVVRRADADQLRQA